MNRISRRAFGGLVASGASLAALASTMPFALAATRLRLIWWGNPDRDKRTLAVVDLYKEGNADVTVDPETYAWNDYWPKLATQAAGQKARLFRRGVDPIHLYISIAGVSYFYFSNIHTLSVIFDVPLESEGEMAARRNHVEDVIMGYLRA